MFINRSESATNTRRDPYVTTIDFKLSLLRKGDIKSENIYKYSRKILEFIYDLEPVSIDTTVKVYNESKDTIKTLNVEYTNDKFFPEYVADYLETIIKTGFPGIESELLDLPDENNTPEMRRLILEARHEVAECPSWIEESRSIRIGIAITLNHDYKLTATYGSDQLVNYVEYESDIRVNHDKVTPYISYYTDHTPSGFIERIDYTTMDVALPGYGISEELDDVANTYNTGHVFAVDFCYEKFTDTIIIVDSDCRNLLRYPHVDEEYVWFDTYEAARFLIKTYSKHHPNYNKISLRLICK